MPNMSWNEAKKRLQGIEGIITEKEEKCLYGFAKDCGGDVVEIGSWKGRSTVCLAFARSGLAVGVAAFSAPSATPFTAKASEPVISHNACFM